jgi:hypothetical protein
MREVVVHVDGRPYKGTWDTWEDDAWGRIVELTRDEWLVRCPVKDESPIHVAERALEWCVRESLADRRR